VCGLLCQSGGTRERVRCLAAAHETGPTGVAGIGPGIQSDPAAFWLPNLNTNDISQPTGDVTTKFGKRDGARTNFQCRPILG
jgi:hypothetical protein